METTKEQGASAGVTLRPFAIATEAVFDELCRDGLPTIHRYDPLDPADAPFCLAMNRANCFAYDGKPTPGEEETALGMPRWVMLDCCALPSAILGFDAPASVLADEVRAVIDPGGELSRLPVSEYIGLPGLSPTDVVGISLFSLLPGMRLGRRTKALALAAYGRSRQTGVAQYTNPSLRLHLAFGGLQIVAPRAAIHSRPSETFVYRLAVPEREALISLALGRTRAAHAEERGRSGTVERFDPRERAALDRFAERANGRSVTIVSAELGDDGRVCEIGWVA